jgi:hypothetical protein
LIKAVPEEIVCRNQSDEVASGFHHPHASPDGHSGN